MDMNGVGLQRGVRQMEGSESMEGRKSCTAHTSLILCISSRHCPLLMDRKRHQCHVPHAMQCHAIAAVRAQHWLANGAEFLSNPSALAVDTCGAIQHTLRAD